MAKINIENISRNPFDLNLDFVTPRKVVTIKPNVSYGLTEDEYSYLVTSCPNLFTKGFFKVKNIPDELKNVDVVESSNVMTDNDIVTLLDLPLAKFKKELSKIDSLPLIRDIHSKALELNKTDKYMSEINTKIDILADGSLLI